MKQYVYLHPHIKLTTPVIDMVNVIYGAINGDKGSQEFVSNMKGFGVKFYEVSHGEEENAGKKNLYVVIKNPDSYESLQNGFVRYYYETEHGREEIKVNRDKCAFKKAKDDDDFYRTVFDLCNEVLGLDINYETYCEKLKGIEK